VEPDDCPALRPDQVLHRDPDRVAEPAGLADDLVGRELVAGRRPAEPVDAFELARLLEALHPHRSRAETEVLVEGADERLEVVLVLVVPAVLPGHRFGASSAAAQHAPSRRRIVAGLESRADETSD
jgi:hypothetical protein